MLTNFKETCDANHRFLMSALAFSMVMNVLCLGIVLASVLALRNDIRREAADRLKGMPAWARQR
jgi:hypothetical protein